MTQQDKAAPQAAGAVSIDTEEFQEILGDYVDDSIPQNELTAYINSKLAQQRQEGRRDSHDVHIRVLNAAEKMLVRAEAAESELEEWRFTNRINELQRRCGRAEASLAQMVEGVEEGIHKVLKHHNIVDGVVRGDLLALLPAKAEGPIAFPAPAGWELHPSWASTPAPAMGEELQSIDTPEFQALLELFGREFKLGDSPLGPAKMDIISHIHAFVRACMALRQPADDGIKPEQWKDGYSEGFEAAKALFSAQPAAQSCPPALFADAIARLAAHDAPAARKISDKYLASLAGSQPQPVQAELSEKLVNLIYEEVGFTERADLICKVEAILAEGVK